MKMKRIISLILVLIMIFISLCSCSNNNESNESINSSSELETTNLAPTESEVIELPTETSSSTTISETVKVYEYETPWTYVSNHNVSEELALKFKNTSNFTLGTVFSATAYIGYQEGEESINHLFFGATGDIAADNLNMGIFYISENKTNGKCTFYRCKRLSDTYLFDDTEFGINNPKDHNIDGGVMSKFKEAFSQYEGVGLKPILLAGIQKGEGTDYYILCESFPVGPREIFPYDESNPNFRIMRLYISDMGETYFH